MEETRQHYRFNDSRQDVDHVFQKNSIIRKRDMEDQLEEVLDNIRQRIKEALSENKEIIFKEENVFSQFADKDSEPLEQILTIRIKK
jgi:gas vesicle protein